VSIMGLLPHVVCLARHVSGVTSVTPVATGTLACRMNALRGRREGDRRERVPALLDGVGSDGQIVTTWDGSGWLRAVPARSVR
jgi:hypothetical protein